MLEPKRWTITVAMCLALYVSLRPADRPETREGMTPARVVIASHSGTPGAPPTAVLGRARAIAREVEAEAEAEAETDGGVELTMTWQGRMQVATEGAVLSISGLPTEVERLVAANAKRTLDPADHAFTYHLEADGGWSTGHARCQPDGSIWLMARADGKGFRTASTFDRVRLFLMLR